MELSVADIWSELLGVDVTSLSASSNFFAEGGHSLLMLQLLKEINSKLSSTIELQDIYQNQTIKTQAEVIELSLLGNQWNQVTEGTVADESAEIII